MPNNRPSDGYPVRPGYVPEEWLGQILHDDGRWLDYARAHEAPARTWQAADPANRRVVHWISRDVLIPAVDHTEDLP